LKERLCHSRELLGTQLPRYPARRAPQCGAADRGPRFDWRSRERWPVVLGPRSRGWGCVHGGPAGLADSRVMHACRATWRCVRAVFAHRHGLHGIIGSALRVL